MDTLSKVFHSSYIVFMESCIPKNKSEFRKYFYWRLKDIKQIMNF